MLGRTPQSYCVTQLGSSWCSLGSLPTWQRHPFHLLYMSACTWPSCGHVWRQTIGDLSDDTVACLSESHNYWIWNNPHFKIVSLFKMLLIVWNHFFFLSRSDVQCWIELMPHFPAYFHSTRIIFLPPPPDSSSSCGGKWRLLEPDIPRAGSHFGQQRGVWPGFHRSIYLHRILQQKK